MIETSTLPAPTVRRLAVDWRAATAAGLGGALFFFFLSGVLGVRSGATITRRLDVLFSSDLASRVHNLSGAREATAELRTHPVSVSHPLMNQVWGTLGGALAFVCRTFLPEPAASLIAARSMVAAVAGIGIGLVCAVGVGLGGWSMPALVLSTVCLLSTSNVLVAMPDHMGLSSGLLAAAAVILTAMKRASRQVFLFCGVSALIASTTVTNALFPCGALLYVERRRRQDRRLWLTLIAAVCAVAIATGAALAWTEPGQRFRNGDSIVFQFLNVRWLRNPASAVVLLPAAVIYPVVGPAPRTVGQLARGLSYEPVDFHGYTRLGVISAACWVILIGWSAWSAVTREETTTLARLLIGWVVFNAAFHSVWGDEFFLYSPHWSWALGMLLMAGAPRIPKPAAVALGLAVLPGQIVALYSIYVVLQRI